jgi:hypothetical protein
MCSKNSARVDKAAYQGRVGEGSGRSWPRRTLVTRRLPSELGGNKKHALSKARGGEIPAPREIRERIGAISRHRLYLTRKVETSQSGNPVKSRVSGQRSKKLRSTAQTRSFVIAQDVETRGYSTTSFAQGQSNTNFNAYPYGNGVFGNANTTARAWGSAFTTPNRRGNTRVLAIKFI